MEGSIFGGVAGEWLLSESVEKISPFRELNSCPFGKLADLGG
ncbi:hypothetical protein COLO4_36441 [Corchorus olitorius]|uniref:Uncharacterized protein n=1 Tax=Corchorus olitorius TaxID=93759 RepID=A0A1R3G927_9ROSI|nr:hypothetical protein COLO4_36440 [Corchorus olitorius]OMO54520.1 hypothetical protein COLO4_36441 [Corchorus olitorius]